MFVLSVLPSTVRSSCDSVRSAAYSHYVFLWSPPSLLTSFQSSHESTTFIIPRKFLNSPTFMIPLCINITFRQYCAICGAFIQCCAIHGAFTQCCAVHSAFTVLCYPWCFYTVLCYLCYFYRMLCYPWCFYTVLCYPCYFYTVLCYPWYYRAKNCETSDITYF